MGVELTIYGVRRIKETEARELTGLSQYLLSKYIKEYTASQVKDVENSEIS